jgi:rod shape-determining protein MreD
MIAGFLLGLLVDAPTPAWMGASSAAYALVGYLAGSYGQTMHMDKTLARGILVIGSVLVFDICFGLVTVGIARPLWLHALSSMGSAVLTGAAAAGITLLLKYVQTRARAGGEQPARA